MNAGRSETPATRTVSRSRAHDETIRRETGEEARYEIARASGLILAATVDEFRDRQRTQVLSYQSEVDDLRIELQLERDDRRKAYDSLAEGRRRAPIDAAHVRDLRDALDRANAAINTLAKKARVKPTFVAQPVHPGYDAPPADDPVPF